MSCKTVIQKVIRIPLEKYGITGDEAYERIEMLGSPGQYQFGITACRHGNTYLDLIITCDYTDFSIIDSRIRILYDGEKERFKLIFKSVIPDIDMNDARVVKYAEVEGIAPEDIYDMTDEFYNEIF